MNDKEIRLVMQKTGGATLTRIARQTALYQLRDLFQNQLNIQVRSFQDLKSSHLKTVVSHWLADNLSVRTIQNSLAHVRSALAVHDRADYARSERMSNAALGAAGASRNGTHVALKESEMDEVRAGIKDQGIRACFELQQALGLRAREAISSARSLQSWQADLGRYGHVTVTAGTKGGRPRVVMLADPAACAEATSAIALAQVTTEAGAGNLVDSISLRGACKKYERALAARGMTGERASHSLRCTFARAQFQRYLDAGVDRREALARLSQDLGHGDGRGRYVAQVYL